MTDDASGYGLANVGDSHAIDAPVLDYLPPVPKSYSPNIGLIGCGGISEYHLRAYKTMGLKVVALCDHKLKAAEARRDEFFPDADVTTDDQDLINRDDIEVLDLTPHPEQRVPLIEASLRAGKHVLSQKPFVNDLDTGTRLCDLADECNRLLAVNQNGRWAPHFSWMRQAIAAGLIGRVGQVSISMQWDHRWVKGTPFDDMTDLILMDFGVHWFDICSVFFADQQPVSVSALRGSTPYQTNKTAMLAQVMIQFEHGQATLSFNGDTEFGQQDTTVVCGEHGTLRSAGPSLTDQRVTLFTAHGHASPVLQGNWFENGFQGTMAELLCAIEQNRPPTNNARDNLRTLRLAHAAIQSANHHGAPTALI